MASMTPTCAGEAHPRVAPVAAAGLGLELREHLVPDQVHGTFHDADGHRPLEAEICQVVPARGVLRRPPPPLTTSRALAEVGRILDKPRPFEPAQVVAGLTRVGVEPTREDRRGRRTVETKRAHDLKAQGVGHLPHRGDVGKP